MSSASINSSPCDFFFKQLGKYINLPSLQTDEKGICSLVFDGNLVVHLEPGPDQLYIHMYSEVGPFPKQAYKMKGLLEANLFGTQTAGAAFSFYAPTNSIYLTHRLWVDKTDFYHLRRQMEAFIDRLEFWKRHLGRGPGLLYSEKSTLGISEAVAQIEDSLIASL